MAASLLDRCVGLLRREDVRTEIKKAVAPVVSLAMDELYPYMHICVMMALVSFILQGWMFLILFRMRASSQTKPSTLSQ